MILEKPAKIQCFRGNLLPGSYTCAIKRRRSSGAGHHHVLRQALRQVVAKSETKVRILVVFTSFLTVEEVPTKLVWNRLSNLIQKLTK